MWVAKFIVCSIMFGGCNEETLKDIKYFTDKEQCEEYAEVLSDVLLLQMEQQGIMGELHYGCVEPDDKEQKI